MVRMDAIGWVVSFCGSLRLSQAKTLSQLVAAATRVGRMSLAEIGRRLTGATTTKSRIQKVCRFTSNERVVVADEMSGVMRWLSLPFQASS